ncbi:lantibiotic dehydratase C-terminal domain-containing protein [Streptomyces sp. NPDC047017]|uniref:lantibiotic dehydratase C-terminal domain-containing protein n=1 Tax=Streptomyces sp. NPDC047017 TaxID=3155024 RepID=UPI0033F74819
MLTRPPEDVPGPEPAGGDRWVGAHVFTGHPLDLVVGALLPEAVAELRRRGLADRFFFLRHWQGGPHLRLRVRLTAPAAEPAVRAALEAHTAAFFRTLPPSRPMTAQQYRSLSRQLAAREPESEPGALAPNDSLAFHAYRPEYGKYGRGAALRAVEEAFATCSELALAAVLARWSPARRSAHCFALLAGSMDVREARAAGNARAAGDAGVSPGGPAPGVLAQYRDRRAALLTVARAVRTAVPADAAAPTAATATTDQTGTDPVIKWLAACRNAQRQAATLPALPARLAGHLTHLACNRLDVRLGQEAALRALALLSVAELTDGDPPPPRHDGTAPP